MTPETGAVRSELQHEPEMHFAQAEQWRIRHGYDVLMHLLSTGDQDVKKLLSNVEIPQDFDINRDYLTPREHRAHYTITDSQGVSYEVTAVRFQCDIVNPKNLEHVGISAMTGGGVRFEAMQGTLQEGQWRHKDVEAVARHIKDSGVALASAMTPKNSGLEFRKQLSKVLKRMGRNDLLDYADRFFLSGGGKADVILAKPDEWDNPDVYPNERKAEITALALEGLGYELGKRNVIGPGKDRLAGDSGTTISYNGRPVVEFILDGYRRGRKEMGFEASEIDGMVVSGKKSNGLEARGDATGWGAWSAFKEYLTIHGVPFEGLKISAYGTGDSVKRSIMEAYRHGMKVVSAGSGRGIILRPDGFSDEDAVGMWKERGGNIADWAREQLLAGNFTVHLYYEGNGSFWTKELANKLSHIWQKDGFIPDVVFAAAAESIINCDTVQCLPEGCLILENANGPVTPEAAASRPDITILPGVEVNAGGVGTSWFECVQHAFRVKFKNEDIEAVIGEMMAENVRTTEQIISLAKTRYGMEITHQMAFYALAIARGIADRNEFATKAATLHEIASDEPLHRIELWSAVYKTVALPLS